MKKKRIIPCLDIKDGKVVKGINFKGINTVGDPIKLAQMYNEDGADELVFLDITASTEKHSLLLELIKKVHAKIDIPLIVGGGINSVEKAQAVIRAGAAKVSVGSAAIQNPNLIPQLAHAIRKENLVIAIDTQKIEGKDWVCIQGGKQKTNWETLTWAREVEKLGAGEILLTSMNTDGVQKGFALEITKEVSEAVNIPVIASGGAGKIEDFITLFTNTKVEAGLAASIFHYGSVSIADLKAQIENI